MHNEDILVPANQSSPGRLLKWREASHLSEIPENLEIFSCT